MIVGTDGTGAIFISCALRDKVCFGGVVTPAGNSTDIFLEQELLECAAVSEGAQRLVNTEGARFHDQNPVS